jgi:hypothetical protein
MADALIEKIRAQTNEVWQASIDAHQTASEGSLHPMSNQTFWF